jgi:DNA-binding NarL/FixJ family response regulator
METERKTVYEQFMAEAAVRRQEVLRLSAEGKKAAQIAKQVGVTSQRIYQILKRPQQ